MQDCLCRREKIIAKMTIRTLEICPVSPECIVIIGKIIAYHIEYTEYLDQRTGITYIYRYNDVSEISGIYNNVYNLDQPWTVI